MNLLFTIDDGPSDNWPRLLQLLEQYQLKATFFCLGIQLEKHPDFAGTAIECGHTLANHGYDHNRFTGKDRNEQIAFWLGVLHTQAILQPHGNENVRPWFRFPHGDSGHGPGVWGVWMRRLSPEWYAGQQWLEEQGFVGPAQVLGTVNCSWPYRGRLQDHDWLWTVDLRDYLPHSGEQNLERIRGQIARPGKKIVLAHDQNSAQIYNLERILYRMHHEGLLCQAS